MTANYRLEKRGDGLEGTYEKLLADPQVREYVELADEAMASIGFTEHGFRHVSLVAENAGRILRELGYSEDEVESAKIAGLLHDIGNMVSREVHPQIGAVLAHPILLRFGLDARQIGTILGAIGNHEEEAGTAFNAVNAAVILADKADVHRSRVRDYQPELEDIHDDVNYACVEASLEVDSVEKTITLNLTIDTEIATLMEYFEIFTSRMVVSREAAEYVGAQFRLVINGTLLS